MEFSVSSVFFGQKAAWSSIHCSCRITIPKPLVSALFDTPQMGKLMLPELIQWNGKPPPGSKAPSARPSARCPANFVLGPGGDIFCLPSGNPSSSIWWLRTRQSASSFFGVNKGMFLHHLGKPIYKSHQKNNFILVTIFLEELSVEDRLMSLWRGIVSPCFIRQGLFQTYQVMSFPQRKKVSSSKTMTPLQVPTA